MDFVTRPGHLTEHSSVTLAELGGAAFRGSIVHIDSRLVNSADNDGPVLTLPLAEPV